MPRQNRRNRESNKKKQHEWAIPMRNKEKIERSMFLGDTLKLPVGIENFEEIRRDGFYYVDKTGLIEQLLNQWGKVNLFTRPRRFGKTLNMSMLRYFFEIGADPTLF